QDAGLIHTSHDSARFGLATFSNLSYDPPVPGGLIKITGFSANYTNPNTAGERTGALFDGTVDTKMYADEFGAPTADKPYEVQWTYSKAFEASKYRLATGNDAPGRDFKSWKLYARNGSSDWALVDTVADAAFGSDRQRYKSFDLDVPGTYDAYKMTVTATASGGDPQMSEIEIPLPPAEITGFSANYTNPNTAGERTGALFDGTVDTKMYADGFGAPTADKPYEVQWTYSKAFEASKYRLATGNDVPGRDFKSWKLYARKGSSDWALVDTVADAAFGSDRQRYKSFDLDVPGTYDAYKMTVTATASGGDPQMSEIEIPLQ
ncbi:hypothetical protein AB0J71_49785, partial [Nonomuraea sp. NPDC049637]|uniref:hypothetical protein n=1 Tax=Nonomuraea sp. NPDC049637 TaxID=3154356 RepID=UPI00342C3FC2